jgi:polyvinyl alcohol dehydrogenase (cytochrome)
LKDRGRGRRPSSSRLAVRAAAIAAVAATSLLAAPGAASAAEQNAYAAALNYATPTVTIGQGDTLVFNNLDTAAQHDLLGHDGRFGSELIGGGESSPVKGVESLEPGQYQFHCSLHSWMQGVLNVTAAGTGAGVPSPTSGAPPGTVPSSASASPFDVYARAPRASIGGASWPLYGHDVANTRDGGADGPAPADVPNLGVAWAFHALDGDFTGTPVVSKGLVVAGSFGGTVYAVDAATGRKRWSHATGLPINGTVATDGKRVYVPLADPHRPKVLALDLRKGRPVWVRQVSNQRNSDVYGSPIVWRGRVYIGISAEYGEVNDPAVNVRGQVVALDSRTGKQKWSTYTVPSGHDGASVWTTPSIDAATGVLYVGTGNAYHEPSANTTDSILGIDTRNGRIVSHYQAYAGDVWNGTDNAAAGPDYDFGASPQLFTTPDGHKVVGAGQKSGTYWALDRGSLAPVWSATVGPGAQVGGIIGSTAVDGQRVYGPNTPAGEAWALGTDGTPAWFSADGGPLKFNATTVANGVVYTTDMTGFLVAREAGTGLSLARIPLGSPTWGGVAVAGGTVFVAVGTQGTGGYLAAYRVRDGVAETQAAEHWEDQAEPDPDEWGKRQEQIRRCKSAKKRLKKARSKSAKRKWRRKAKRYCKVHQDDLENEEDEEHGEHHEGHQHAQGEGTLLQPIRERGDRYVPKPPGTKEHLSFYYGPYVIPPGWDANRVDLELPTNNGFMLSVEPAMRRVADLSEPSHQEAHIHHAHWFGFDPGNAEDNYWRYGGSPGTHEWVFGNGDEETRGDFRRRTDADPNGPVYGEYIPAGRNQEVIYMLHNKTNQPMEVYIVLDVAWEHGTRQQLEELRHRPYHDLVGTLFGRTFNIPREPNGDGKWEYAKDSRDAEGKPRVMEWVATVDGTIMGMGGHLHPGGKTVIAENYGSEENPCPRNSPYYGGTLLLKSDVIDHNAPLSEDYQTEVTHPAWRAPVHKGDRIRISGTYENKDHAWYTVMTHLGVYIDKEEAPKGRCKPYMVGKARKTWKRPTEGVPNRSWGKHTDEICGEAYGEDPCEKPEPEPAEDVFTRQDTVHIANFQYLPGDRSSGTAGGKIPSVPQGQTITFVNDDQFANIRHTITTCPWPCNGRYVANYPLADGRWDSGIMGYDAIDGGNPNPTSETPPDLAPGLYTYFCRIHAWMRGAFRIEAPAMGSSGGAGLPPPPVR